jgi:hypothetical protein
MTHDDVDNSPAVVLHESGAYYTCEGGSPHVFTFGEASVFPNELAAQGAADMLTACAQRGRYYAAVIVGRDDENKATLLAVSRDQFRAAAGGKQ